MSTPPLRRHQRLALDALSRHFGGGHTRAWVELPPGADKTRVALECGSRRENEEQRFTCAAVK